MKVNNKTCRKEPDIGKWSQSTLTMFVGVIALRYCVNNGVQQPPQT